MRVKLLFSILLLVSHFLVAQQADAKAVIGQIAQAESNQRIRLLCIFYDDNLYTNAQGKFDSVIAACYQIAERDNDVMLAAYLDFYKKGRGVMFIPDDDRYIRISKFIDVWNSTLSHYQKEDDKYFVAICNAYIGHFYFLQKEYEKSIEKLLVADEVFQKLGYDKFPDIGKHLHNMALVFYFFRDYGKVAELMENAVKFPAYGVNYDIQRYNTLGAAYIHLKKYKKAEEAYVKTKATAIAYNDSIWITIASRGLAKAWMNEGKYEEALQLYDGTLAMVKEVNSNAGNSLNREYSEHLLGMARTALMLNDIARAKQCLDSISYRTEHHTKEKVFLFGVTWQDMNYWLDFYDVQQQYYYALKNFEKAYRYADSMYAIKYKIDSTFNGLGIQVVQNRIVAQNEQYQNDKKEATIKSREQQLVLITVLLAVIISGSIVLYRTNRKINRQNNIIGMQLKELAKTVEQKQMLLSELQHRVKNNLQHVISILEIQKESIDFNNIEELVRGNQNRIHSMALLHKKMNVSDSVNEVNLGRYVTELAEQVIESYAKPKKKVELNVVCEINTISIEKALPIGLIIVELVSNSIKHAFKKRSIGLITIDVYNSEPLDKNVLYYADNGDGYDFNKASEKGLGQEIIKGLIDQLDGTFETQSKNGFELKIYFQ